MVERIAEQLKAVTGADVVRPDAAKTGVHVDVAVPAASLRRAAQTLRDAEFLIESLTAVDAVPMRVVSHYARIDAFCRVALRVTIDRESPSLPSIHDIYPGANWHEREAHDFFGIVFESHPDLSPLILPEDAGDLRPLRKGEGKVKELGSVVTRFAPPAAPAPDAGPKA